MTREVSGHAARDAFIIPRTDKARKALAGLDDGGVNHGPKFRLQGNGRLMSIE